MKATGFPGLTCEAVTDGLSAEPTIIFPGMPQGDTARSADFAACLKQELPADFTATETETGIQIETGVKDLALVDEPLAEVSESTTVPDQVIHTLLCMANQLQMTPVMPPVASSVADEPPAEVVTAPKSKVEHPRTEGESKNTDSEQAVEKTMARPVASSVRSVPPEKAPSEPVPQTAEGSAARSSKVVAVAAPKTELATMAVGDLEPVSPKEVFRSEVMTPAVTPNMTSTVRHSEREVPVLTKLVLEDVTGKAEATTSLPGKNVPVAAEPPADFSRPEPLPGEFSAVPAPEVPKSKVKKAEKFSDSTLIQSSRHFVEAAGTSVAKPVSAMSAQTPKDQKLEVPAARTVLAVREPSVTTGGHELVQPAFPEAALDRPDRWSGLPVEGAEVTAAGSVDRVERLQELVTKEVRFFRQSGAQVLEMIVEPSPDTRLKLHLELQDGRIEAMLSSAGGDNSWLQAHWPELQRDLSGQGIVLRQFESEVTGNSPSASSFDTQFGSRQEERPRSSVPFEQAPAETQAGGNNTARPRPSYVPTARKAEDSTRQLLEYWA